MKFNPVLLNNFYKSEFFYFYNSLCYDFSIFFFNKEFEPFNFLSFSFYNAYKNYIATKKSNFILFFIKNNIDIPICFKKIKSLKKNNNERWIFKFINFLMKNGLKQKIIKQFFSTFFNFYNKFKIKKFNYFWINYLLLNNVFKINNFKCFFNFNNKINFNLIFSNVFSSNNKLFNNKFFLKNILINKLIQIQPIFNYYIYKIDKNIRKYSRGKTGKYKFIWKYLPAYKRVINIFKLFLKDIKFNYNKKFKERINNLLLLLFFNIKSTFAWKSKTYAYNYIFKNFKSNLLLNFKTIF